MPYEVPKNNEQSAFRGGKTILASLHLKATEEGGTIDASKVGNRYVELGEPFVYNHTTKKYDPFVAATHVTAGVLNAGFSDPVICNVDFNCNGTDDFLVGADLLYTCSVYENMLPAKVTAAFKTLTRPMIRYVKRGL